MPLLRGGGGTRRRSGAGSTAAHPGPRSQPRTFRKKSLRVYACSSHEISSSDSLVPHLPFISAPRDSGMSACSVISYERGAGLSGASPAGRPTTRSAAL